MADTKRQTQLHELLAVATDVGNSAAAIAAETQNTFSKKPEHFKGQARTVSFFDEARKGEDTSDEKALVTTVEQRLEYTLDLLARDYDVQLQMEEANQRAVADIVMADGTVIATNVPGTFLLGMEKRLKKVLEILLTAPTLDPSLTWDADPVRGPNIYVTAPQVSMRQEKKLRHQVLVAASDKHPAQIEKWTEDAAVARIETTHVSGMWTSQRKADVITRTTAMLEAVKTARQRANTTPVADTHIGKALFSYIVG